MSGGWGCWRGRWGGRGGRLEPGCGLRSQYWFGRFDGSASSSSSSASGGSTSSGSSSESGGSTSSGSSSGRVVRPRRVRRLLRVGRRRRVVHRRRVCRHRVGPIPQCRAQRARLSGSGATNTPSGLDGPSTGSLGSAGSGPSLSNGSTGSSRARVTRRRVGRVPRTSARRPTVRRAHPEARRFRPRAPVVPCRARPAWPTPGVR